VKYLLDANAISAMVVNPRGPVAARIAEVGESNVFTSIIVCAEVAFGVKKRASQELTRKVADVMSKIYIASFDPPADAHYAEIGLFLQRQGQPIGPNDLWIAAHALALDAVLVTDNEREFSRVPGLKVENWLRENLAA
jgi:tRNA(fMet)-specific endonuclease VapC